MKTKFIVYGATYCPYCHKARELLESVEMDFEYVDVAYNQEAEAMLMALDLRTIPQIFSVVDDAEPLLIGGYEDLVPVLER